MSIGQKEWLSRMLPWFITLTLSLIGNAIIIGKYQGRTEAKIESLHEADVTLKSEIMPMEKRLEIFYTRREAQTLESLMRDTNSKVDHIYRRELSDK